MADYEKDLKGVLFKNDKKETENHPDYKGNALVGGAEFWISAWINEKKDGTGKYMSLSFSPKEAKASGYDSFQAQGEKLKKPDVVHDITDEPINLDDIPF